MKARWLLNLALVVLIVGLALLVLWRPGQPPARPTLTALDPAAVTRIRLERPGQEPVELARDADAWRMTAPLKARANRLAADGLARLAAAPIEVHLGATTDLGQYGLATPRAGVRLNDEEIALGALHPINNQVYALYRGEVHLIGAHRQGPSLYPLGQLLDNRLLEPESKPLAFLLPGFRLTLKEGAWQREPATKDLSSDRINDFVQEWRHASALAVERYDGRRGLERIEIAFARNGEPHKLVLRVLAHRPEFVLARPDEGLEYHFPEETGRRLMTLGEK